jgi:hypothetical protein
MFSAMGTIDAFSHLWHDFPYGCPRLLNLRDQLSGENAG